MGRSNALSCNKLKLFGNPLKSVVPRFMRKLKLAEKQLRYGKKPLNRDAKSKMGNPQPSLYVRYDRI